MKKVFLLQMTRVPNEKPHKHGKVQSMNATTLDKFLLSHFKETEFLKNFHQIISLYVVYFKSTHST